MQAQEQAPVVPPYRLWTLVEEHDGDLPADPQARPLPRRITSRANWYEGDGTRVTDPERIRELEDGLRDTQGEDYVPLEGANRDALDQRD